MNPEPSAEDVERRVQWFERYADTLANHSVVVPSQEGVTHCCPCYQYKTLDERGSFEICAACFWEDDGQDNHDADTTRGGPNGSLSLTQARANFLEFGACEKRFVNKVRKPLQGEM